MERADFNIIRYANCWEDADNLLAGLALQPGNKILSIASAGDNSLALLATAPEQVLAIDISLPQLYLTELKQFAFAFLDRTEVLQLLGIGVAKHESMAIYKHLEPRLSAGAQSFWSSRKALIETGLIHAGKFEQYFKKFRTYFLPLVQSKAAVKKLLAHKQPEEQMVFYNTGWNTWRWKLLMGLFFSKYVMGKYGRTPQFLAHVKLPVAAYIKKRAEEHLRSPDSTANYFLHMIFTGSFGANLPFYLRAENFDAIKENIHKLRLSQMDANYAVKQQSFDVYNFSNIFEYMSEEVFDQLAAEWVGFIPRGARLAFWNLMNGRSFSEAQPAHFKCDPKSNILSEKDKGFFYSRFLLEHKL